MRWPSFQPPFLHISSIDLRQNVHVAQEVMQAIRTLSPFLKFFTSGPTESTTPTPSWPRTRPFGTVGTSPLMMCRSVPQIVVRVSFTTASEGCSALRLGAVLYRDIPRTIVHEGFHGFKSIVST